MKERDKIALSVIQHQTSKSTGADICYLTFLLWEGRSLKRLLFAKQKMNTYDEYYPSWIFVEAVTDQSSLLPKVKRPLPTKA